MNRDVIVNRIVSGVYHLLQSKGIPINEERLAQVVDNILFEKEEWISMLKEGVSTDTEIANGLATRIALDILERDYDSLTYGKLADTVLVGLRSG